MTWESGSTDQQRLRAGYAALSLGVFTLLGVWIISVMRGPQALGDAAVRHQKLDPPNPQQVLPVISAGMIIIGLSLVLVLFVSLIALLRVSRRFRKSVLESPASTTSTTDVWQMHRVPDLPDDHLTDDHLPDDDTTERSK